MAGKHDLAPLLGFNPHSDQGKVNARWKSWIKRFQTFIKAAKISNNTRHQAGPEMQAIFQTLANTGRDDDLDSAITYFENRLFCSHKKHRF